MKRGRVIVYAVLLVMFLAACGKSAETLLQEQLDLGYRYLSEMNYEQAIIAFNKAIEIDEKAAEAYAGLGAVYSAQENYSAAAEAYRQALALQPENSEINQNISARARESHYKILAADYPFLEKDRYVCCGELKEIHTSDFFQRFKQGIVGTIRPDHLDVIRGIIAMSANVSAGVLKSYGII